MNKAKRILINRSLINFYKMETKNRVTYVRYIIEQFIKYNYGDKKKPIFMYREMITCLRHDTDVHPEQEYCFVLGKLCEW